MYLKHFLTANCLFGTVLSFMSQNSHPMVHNLRPQEAQLKPFLWSHYKTASKTRFLSSNGPLRLNINRKPNASMKEERDLFLGTQTGLFHGPRKRRDTPAETSDFIFASMTKSSSSKMTSSTSLQELKRGRSFDSEEVYLDPIFRIPVVKMPGKKSSKNKLKIDPKIENRKTESNVQNIEKRIGTGPGIHTWRPLPTSVRLSSSRYPEPPLGFTMDRYTTMKPYYDVQPSTIEHWTTTLSEYYSQVHTVLVHTILRKFQHFKTAFTTSKCC